MRQRYFDIIFIAAMVVLSLMARIALLPLESVDWEGPVSGWVHRIQELGAWNSLGVAVSDYTSSYMYVLCLISGFSNSLVATKAASIVFDYAAAFVIFLLIKQLTGDRRKSILASAIFLFCPTILINSAWWANCDIHYAFFTLLALLFLFKDKGALCCIMMGIAYSFKQQAIFILPFLVILCAKGKTIKAWHFLLIPIVFVLIQVPACIAGRPLIELLRVYYLQAGEYPWCTMNFPNIYEFLDETLFHWHNMKEMTAFGLAFSFGAMGVFAWWMYSQKFRMTGEILVTMALFSVSLALFTLPHMHERYGFIVDMLAIIYAVQRPSKTPIAIGYISVSLLSYMWFLHSAILIPHIYLAAALMVLNALVCMDLAKQIKENPS